MPVPSLITELSQTAGSNSPAGSESPITTDDYLRAHAAFIAQLRDGNGFDTPDITGPVTITANSSSSALRVTQTGSGNALLVEDAANPDSTPFVINSDGNIVTGDTTARTYGGFTYRLAIETTPATGQGAIINRWAASSGGARSGIGKSRGAAPGTMGAVATNDTIGTFFFAGDDGTGFVDAVTWRAEVGGAAVSTGIVPGRAILAVRDTAGVLNDVLTVRPDGNVGIGKGVGGGSSISLSLGGQMTGATSVVGMDSTGEVQSGVTGTVSVYRSAPTMAAAAFTANELRHFTVNGATLGAGSAITSQTAFFASATLTQGATNQGFYGNIGAAAGRWNLYMAGTAQNYLAGNLGIGITTPQQLVDVAGSNNGLTSDTATNTIRFTDTDTTTAANQPIGKVEFYTSDATNASIASHILARAIGTSGGGRLEFGVSPNASSSTVKFVMGENGELGLNGANYGTAGQVPVSAGSGSPAVWGVQAMRGRIDGLIMSTAGSSATMTIGAGEATNSTSVATLVLSSSLAKTTSAWAVGSGNGGLDTGTIANSTWYYFYVIRRPDTGVVDVVFSTNSSSPTLPTNYTQFRYIGAGLTNGSAQWTSFAQVGNKFTWNTPVADFSSAGTNGATTMTISVPRRVVLAKLTFIPAAGQNARLNALTESDTTAYYHAIGPAAATIEAWTNASAQVRRRENNTSAISYYTEGWTDLRGMDA